jgi:hypothetical protein
MDYEFRIKLLETETAHLKAMQKLIAGHEDITDNRLGNCEDIIRDRLGSLEKTR